MKEKQRSNLVKDLTDPKKKGQFAEILGKYDIPHKEVFDRLIELHYQAKAKAISERNKPPRTDLEHIQEVVIYLNHLIEERFEEVIDLKGKAGEFGSLDVLRKKVEIAKQKSDFLLCTALYHDIGKAVIRPRHGPEGADIIKGSNSENRKRFYALGLSRADIYLMSDLTRFHDYLAMVGTGETSYLTFVEVLHPVTNSSLAFEQNFLDYLLLVNLADVAGSIGKIGREVFNRLIHDFELIKKAHKYISIKVYEDIFKEKPEEADAKVHEKTITARDLIDVASELQRLAENSSAERLRRMLNSALKTALNSLEQGKDKNRLKEYNKWIKEKYIEEYGNTQKGHQKPKELKEWFAEGDVAPITASLRGYNVGQAFYTDFALICKFDYLLGVLSQLVKEMITIEINTTDLQKRSPHDMRRDLAMCVIKLICTMVSLFGRLTSNNTRIGLGFERFTQMEQDSQKKLLSRLTGEKGIFKEAEAYTKLRDSINIWIITPCP